MTDVAEKDRFQPRYTVSSLTDAVRGVLEPAFRRVFVDGEISGWRVYPSGHAYFTLKDADAQVSCVMFASCLGRCKARAGLGDGAKVLVCGKVTVYGPRGNYQLVVTDARLEGEGELMRRYLALKAKLEREGLFDAARKRPLPPMPRRIGIVTSPAGAVIHDMCRVLTRRFPDLAITLFPASVQGADAPRALMAGLAYFNANPPDLVILARGGGSFEDLFCFNDEALVRAVAASVAPIVSAVGHESDFTLCDFAADVRAGTPSMAAELAVPVEAELAARVAESRRRLAAALRTKGEWFAQRLDHLSDSLAGSLSVAAGRAETRLARVRAGLEPAVHLALTRTETRLARARTGLEPSVRLAVTRAEAHFAEAKKALALLSPYGALARGYALVTDAAGAVVTDAARVAAGSRLDIRLAHGRVAATVGAVTPEA